MAIKAIINNTEKEIEQIKNSDGQDIDYVYSRIGEKEAEGESTVSIKSIGGELTNYRIYGNTINGESVGDRTANLWDEIYEEDGTLHYVPIAVGDGLFTLSTTIPNGPPANIFFLAGNVGSGASTVRNGVWGENSRTIKAVDGYVTIAYEAGQSYGEQCYPWNNDTMLNAGSTALPYEPYGYRVPVTIEGKNLLQNTVKSQTKNGVTFTVNNDGSITCNGTASNNTFLKIGDLSLTSQSYILTGCPSEGGNDSYSLRCYKNGNIKGADVGNGFNINESIDGYIEIRIASGYTCDNLTFYPMICKADIKDDTYEPYHEPITTNLYLPEQIKMVGDEAEYVDFKEQKFHKIGADDINVTLPALSTIKGTNTLSVNTSIQPSNIYIKDGFDYKRVFTATRAIEGIPPLTYKAVEGALNNYRIYGNTVDGESVGDRTANLFNGELQNGYWNTLETLAQTSSAVFRSFKIFLPAGTYTITFATNVNIVRLIADGAVTQNIGNNLTEYTFTTQTNDDVGFSFRITGTSQVPWDNSDIMLNIGSAAIPYEPYGYRVPVTVTNGTDTETTNIYLDEQLTKSGDNADYIDYATQKRHNSDGTESSITLPEIAVTAGSNTLSVETGVQPSEIYLKGKIKKKPKIYYYSQDGQTLLYTESVLKGSNGMYSGTPTKMADSQYTYTFAGWSSSTGQTTATPEVRNNIQNDKNVYAAFSQTLNTYTVYFYNESDTPIETVQNVPYGGTATYTGATPTKQGYSFTGWSPLPTNITADTSCYAQFKAPYITDSWEVISQRSAAGTAQNYYSVGDCKPVYLNGTMGTLALDTTLYVYILGFNHNSALEGNGISFGCFKTAATNGIDVCLVDSKCGSSDTSGTKYFNMSHRGNYNYGGWKGSDMRYDILGSTNVQPSGYSSSKTGHDATSTCATNPVANTLMSCLPSGLRSVMKPMTKYTDAKGNSSNVEANVTTSIDYLPLLSAYEVQGTGTYANKYEKNKQAQYTYYSGGNSKVKYSHSATSTAVAWWVRSPSYLSGDRFCRVSTGGGASIVDAGYSLGVAPCFLV